VIAIFYNLIFLKLKEEYVKWYSSHLHRDIEMLIFGDGGLPVILFPTSMGRYYQSKDLRLIESASSLIEQGLFKIYCPDSIDTDSWYNKFLHPSERIKNHVLYEKMILEDVVKKAINETGNEKVIMAGCSFGAYHACNFTFKHPSYVKNLILMGGAFDIKLFLDGFYDEQCYFNNPPDFLRDLDHPDLKDLEVILGIGENDFWKSHNLLFSEILTQKGINTCLDIRPGAIHDWPLWRTIFPYYLSQIDLSLKVSV
jgi:esterase/lipase superfamily enzyme